MRTHILGLAAVLAAASAVPAAAQTYNFTPSIGVHGGSGLPSPRAHGGHEGWRDGRTADRRDRRGRYPRYRYGNGFAYYGGEWALYNNRSFEPDSYNDWWHERPERSLPRWTRNNGDCRQQYWTSAGWTC